MNTVLLLLAAYVVTGIALTVYDFAAPRLHAKMYVIRQDHGAAFRNWFTWPLSTAFEIYQLRKLRRHPVRHLVGVVLLAVGNLVVLRFVYLVSVLFISWTIVPYVLALAIAVFVSPVIGSITMPPHGQARRAARPNEEL